MSAKAERIPASKSVCEPLEGRMFLSVSAGSYSPAVTSGAAVFQPHAAVTTRTTLVVSTSSTVIGQSVTFTATVKRRNGSAVPDGVVNFTSNGVLFGSAPVIGGVAVLNSGGLQVGTDQVVATYAATAAYLGSSSAAVTHTVAKGNSTTTVLSSDLSANMGEIQTFTTTTRTVLPAAVKPRGVMQFFDGATLLGTGLVNKKGHAVLTVTNFFLGNHTITAKFLGNVNFNAGGASPGITQSIVQGPTTTKANGLQIATTVPNTAPGAGSGAASGNTLVVNYTGYLTNGTKFDSSLNPGRTPFVFTLGQGQVIQGWDQGLVGMKVGEQRLLIIPPALGYGATPQNGIPANSTLMFVVQLVRFGQPMLVVGGGSSHNVPVGYGQVPSVTNGTIFNSTKVGQSSATATFEISNGGEASLSFAANPPVSIGGANAADFVLTQPVISGNSALFTVIFKPKGKGTRTATVGIATNDPVHPIYLFTITGTGT